MAIKSSQRDGGSFLSPVKSHKFNVCLDAHHLTSHQGGEKTAALSWPSPGQAHRIYNLQNWVLTILRPTTNHIFYPGIRNQKGRSILTSAHKLTRLKCLSAFPVSHSQLQVHPLFSNYI